MDAKECKKAISDFEIQSRFCCLFILILLLQKERNESKRLLNFEGCALCALELPAKRAENKEIGGDARAFRKTESCFPRPPVGASPSAHYDRTCRCGTSGRSEQSERKEKNMKKDMNKIKKTGIPKTRKILMTFEEYQAVQLGLSEIEATTGYGNLLEKDISRYKEVEASLRSLISKFTTTEKKRYGNN